MAPEKQTSHSSRINRYFSSRLMRTNFPELSSNSTLFHYEAVLDDELRKENV